MTPAEFYEKVREILNQHADQLIEQVDSLRIFACVRAEGGETEIGITVGRGSRYAQRGVVQEWLTNENEHDREDAREERFFVCEECQDREDEEDGGESEE